MGEGLPPRSTPENMMYTHGEASEPGWTGDLPTSPLGAELIAEERGRGRGTALSDQPSRRNLARRLRGAARQEAAGGVEDPSGAQIRIPVLVREELAIVGQLNGLQDCPICMRSGQSLKYIGSKQLAKHVGGEHPAASITWLCAGCGRPCRSIQSWRCHLPHCKGPHEAEQLPFRCDHCGMSFSSQSGVSQHERHAHPVVRNDKRSAEAAPSNVKKGRAASVWSDEDLRLIGELELQYAGSRAINVEIARHFPNKTNKQVSDARRRIKETERRGAETPEHPPRPLRHTNRVRGSPSENGESRPRALPMPSLEEVEEASDRGSSGATGVPNNTTEPPIERETSPPEGWRQPLEREMRCGNAEELGRFQDWGGLVQSHIESKNNASQEEVDGLYEAFASHIVSSKASDRNDRRASHGGRGRRKIGRRRPPTSAEMRRFSYARCQTLWDKCPRRLAEIVASNDLSLLKQQAAPTLTDTESLYRELWGAEGPSNVAGLYQPVNDGPIPVESTLIPVTPSEVRKRISKIRGDSAAGPDGFVKTDLRGEETIKALSKLFNLLLWACKFPTAWRVNRTTLLPKSGKDVSDVRNWRPITISSMISRIFSSLLDQRLRASIRQHDRQKGFTEEHGCFANITLFEAAIKAAKRSGGVFNVLDISKAFDTIPHSVIPLGLERKGVHPLVAGYIADMFSNCSTVIKAREGEVSITLRRGVKQGDPLSPLIFNLAIEPLIEQLSKTSGVDIDNNNLPVLAFADDITCIARDAREAQGQLRMVSDFMSSLCMSISVSKCSTFELVPRGKTWYTRRPEMVMGGTVIPFVQADEVIKYLGAQVSSWRGLAGGKECGALREVIARVRSLPMKPIQKVQLLGTYIFPRFTYGFIVNPPSRAVLREYDGIIRTEVKGILHLPHSVSTAFLYTPRAQGGMGLLETEKMVMIASLRACIKAKQSPDPVVRAAANMYGVEKRSSAYAEAIGLQWPLSLRELDKKKYELRMSYVQEWAKLRWQGQGAMDFAEDALCNKWLKGGLLSHSRVTDAIKLRTNTYPTRSLMNIIDQHADPMCRKCRCRRETLGHILGDCRYTKDKRINRHNEIKDLLKARLTGKFPDVMDEPEVRVNGQRFKPDLVVRTLKNEVLVIDVTVRYEHRDYLSGACAEKSTKYKSVAAQLARDFQSNEKRVLPIVIGSRGAIPRFTKEALNYLKIGKKDWLTISMIALRSSIEMINAFMDDDFL